MWNKSNWPKWIDTGLVKCQAKVQPRENNRCLVVGRVIFMVDDDVEDGKYEYALGFDAIERKLQKTFVPSEKEPTCPGPARQLNGFPVPVEMAKAIQEGKCKNIMLADGVYELVVVDSDGHLHCDDGPSLIYTIDETKRIWPSRCANGGKMHRWYEHGTCTKQEIVIPEPNPNWKQGTEIV